MQSIRSPQFLNAIWMLGVPLLLGIVEVFHPHPHNLLDLDVGRWLAVHYTQLLLFPLSALAVAGLVRDRVGSAARLCQIAMFVFAVSYIAFDTAAGIVTGILVQAAHRSGSPDSWMPAINAVWEHPVMGGAANTPDLLAVLGSIALSVGTVCCAFSLKKAGASWAPSVLFAVSGFGIGIFRTHAWPGGPLTFWGIGIAAAWILWEERRRLEAASQRLQARS